MLSDSYNVHFKQCLVTPISNVLDFRGRKKTSIDLAVKRVNVIE